VANIFGQNLSAAAVNAIKINATNVTNAEQKVAVATLGGSIRLPAVAVTSRVASSGALPKRSTFRMNISLGDVIGFNPVCLPGDITAKEIFAEVRVPIHGAAVRTGLTANGVIAVRTTTSTVLAEYRRTSTVSTGGSATRSHSAASFSAPSARRILPTCTADCS
jgi:hypothetical protein